MQLDAAAPRGQLRRRLGAAACALLAAGLPSAARAEATGDWQLDGSLLLYGERDRASVFEPVARISRLFDNGHRLSGEFAYDAISGASPTGALPSGQVQTTTTPSGNTVTIAAGAVPTVLFRDDRYAADLEWQAPLARTARATITGHFSSEKDYLSRGGSASIALDMFQRLLTVTAGAGVNADEVMPVGGTRVGLGDGTQMLATGTNPKDVTSGMLGVTRVITRRWLVGLTGSFESERGYLTEPYKVVSLVDPVTQEVSGQLTEKRPDTRERKSLQVSSVYHLSEDILYLSYRAYRDDWRVESSTGDVRYRFELADGRYLLPHVRYYAQHAASFYVAGLVAGEPLPAYASADYRLGPLRTATLGLTYGFHAGSLPGTVSLRGEYMRQWLANPSGGDGEGGDDARAGGVQLAGTATAAALTSVSGTPPLHIATLLAGYSVNF